MNKILIATGIYPPDIGGPATILRALAASLASYDFDVKIITYSDEIHDNSGQNKVYRIKRDQNIILRYLKYFWRMWRLAFWADVIYATDVYSVGWFAYLLKKLSGKKYVVRFAGDSAWEMAAANGWTKDYIVDFQDKIYNEKIEKLKARRRKILKNADQVIAVSRFMALIAKKIGVGEDNIKVIYNAVDFIKDADEDPNLLKRIKEQFGKNAKIIATACRLTPWKGVDGIIKILPKLKEKIGEVNLLVLGDGKELNNLEELAEKLDVKKDVHFLGKIKHDKVMSYFKAADLFILNSNYEGLSHTLLEVMEAKTPIITTRIGGNPEIIDAGQEGLLVDYNNQAELLEAGIKILTNKEIAEDLAAKAKEKLKKFNWNEAVAETAKVLKGVCHE